ncbi:MAG TPA: 50S ribosomal protein L24 [Alphaproteobacteria bacterium]|jgi:large subunit ribosomal protein L24
MKIKKGDNVVVLAGRDKGKKGSVLRVLAKDGRAFVQGINMVKRHTAPSAGQTGGIVEKEAPIHVSNLAIVDPKDGKPARIGYKFIEGGEKKVRFAKRSGELID